MSEELKSIQEVLVEIKQILKNIAEGENNYNKELLKHLEKQEKLIELINREAAEGIIHTIPGFSVKFQYTNGLSSKKVINEDLTDLCRIGIIKFFDNFTDYGFEYDKFNTYNKYPTMFMCTSRMQLKVGDIFIEVRPTHYKELADGSIRELEACSI